MSPTARLVHASAGLALTLALLAAGAVGVAAARGVTPHVEVSDSMRPLLRAGDVVWLSELRAREARIGDVVAFAHPDHGDTVLHRVVRISRSGGSLSFVTHGDANTGVERWSVPADGRLGRYAGVRVPAVARLGGAPLAAISGLLLAGLLVRRIWR